MKRNLFFILPKLITLLLVISLAGTAWGAKVDPYKLTPTPAIRGDESFDYLITKAPTIFPNAYCGETTILSPYDTCIGCTWYDYQHNARIPRMNANDYQNITAGGHGHHYSFMYQDQWGDIGRRYVSVTYYDADSGWKQIPASTITNQNSHAGYCGISIFLDSRGVPYYHTTDPVFPNPDDIGVVISIEPNLPGELEFKNANYWYDIPDSADNSGFKGMWPAADVDSDDQIHIVMNEGDTSPGPAWMGYIRCTENPGGDTLTCQSPGKPVYTIVKETQYFNPLNQISVFDTTGVISANLTCSRVSAKVAIVYAALAETETDSNLYQISNDVFYVESPNGGDNWFTDPDSMQMRRNCSNYQVEDKMRCYGEVTGVYDFTDTLHVFWHTHYYDQEAVEMDINDVALWHFSEKTKRFCDGDTVYANQIHTARWEDANAGAWNRLIAKITSGVGILEGDNKNYLYVTWTQFDTAKWNDAGNQTQGDLYTTVSTDAGMTWMAPVNITHSWVDSCAAGECASDHWGSMAERVDDYLHLQWIYDLDVGGVAQEEGDATNNPVLVYDFDKDNIPLEDKAKIVWTPEDFIKPYVHCSTNGQTTVTLVLENIGTAQLQNITLTETATWLSIGSYPPSIDAGSCPEKVTLTITGQGAEEFYVDSIHVTSNDQAGNNDFYIRLHVVMSDVYVAPQFTTVDNPNYYLSVSNVGNLGSQNDTAGFFLHQDPNQINLLFDGSPVLAFKSPIDQKLVGRYSYDDFYFLPETELTVTDFPDLKTKVVEAKFCPVTPHLPLPWHHRWWYWTIRTKDYIFYSETPTNNNEQYLALKYIQLYHNDPLPWWPDIIPPPDIPVTYLGMALDIDCPTNNDAWNYPGFDESRRMGYLQGYGGVNENYRMAIAQRDTCFYSVTPQGTIQCCWPDPNILLLPEQPHGLHLLRNSLWILPTLGYVDEELYDWMSTSGFSVDGPGGVDDYNIVTTGRVIPPQPFPTDTTYSLAYAIAVSDQADISHLNTLIDIIMCGNVNRDKYVNIADVVYLVNYLLKDGEEIWRYMGDVDADGDSDIADAVYLVNYFLKDGPPPQCSAL